MVFQHLFGMVIAYLGIYLGVLLGINSPEEMKPGEKWLKLLSSLIYGAIIGVALSYFILNAPNFIHYGLAVILTLLVLPRIVKIDTIVTYLFFAMLLALFVTNTGYFIALASLVFFYGFSTGSLIVMPHTEHKRILKPWQKFFQEAWKETWGYPLFVLVLFIFFFFIP